MNKLIKFKKVVTWLSQLQTGKLDNVKLVYTTGGIPNDVHEGGKDTYLYVAVNIKDANLKLDKLDLNNVHSVIEFCDKHKLKRYAGIKMDSDKTYETSSKNKEFIDFEKEKANYSLNKGHFAYIFDRTIDDHGKVCTCVECALRKSLVGDAHLLFLLFLPRSF